MSRVGKKTITVPAGVTVTINGADVTVKGAKGELSWTLPTGISAAQEGAVLTVSCTARAAPSSPTWWRVCPRASRRSSKSSVWV